MELKIINTKPLTVCDSLGQYMRLSILDNQVTEKLMNLNKRHRERNFSLCLNAWKFVLKRIPGQDEFYYDVLGYEWE